jgi:hypothetical protein
MSVLDMDNFFHNEQFGFLVVETFDLKCYGFNLKREDQRVTAKKIIQDVNSFIVNGWKVARDIECTKQWCLKTFTWRVKLF